MAYTVLARKYRSSNFDELVGQEHIAQTLKRAIETNRIAHAFLFCGTRGTGKTSTARILAKALNCQKSDEPTTDPCDKCESCKSIARGDGMDVIEIDAASNTGVDDVREVIANAQYRPVGSRFKIYIIDEVHMLSKQAFNALLKTLEEPPEHVKFILATTETEKVLPTIQSRCQRYDFRNIPTREIASHLAVICKQEKIKADEDALLLVAKAGAGSMRDALSLLDRLLSLGEKNLTVELIEQMLGLPKSQVIFDVAGAIGEGDTRKTLSIANDVITRGLSPETFVSSLIDHLHNLLIIRTCGMESGLVEVPGVSPKDLREQADKFEPAILTQDIAVLEELKRSLRTAQAGRALLDATLVRLALAEQFKSITELLADNSNGSSPATAGQKKKSELTPPAPSIRGEGQLQATTKIAASNPATTQVSDIQSPARLESDPLPEYRKKEQHGGVSTEESGADELPAVGRVWEGEKLSLSAAFKKHNAHRDVRREPSHAPADSPPEPLNVEPVDPSDLSAVMQRLQSAVTHQHGVAAFLSQGHLKSIGDNLAVIAFSEKNSTSVSMLERGNKKQIVTEALSSVIGQPMAIKFEVDPAMEAPTATEPARAAPVAQRSEPSRAPAPMPQQPVIRLTPELKEKLAQDELVNAVITELGGEIVKVE